MSASTLSSDAHFWNKIAEKYAADPIKDEVAYEATLDRVRHWLKPDWKVLEIGCGTGNTAVKLAPSVLEYTGTDLSSEMIRMAEGRKAQVDLPGLSFHPAQAEAVTREGQFDAVLAFNLVHLVEEPAALLAQIRAQLPEGGMFLSKTPCLANKPWLKPLVWLAKALGKAPKTVHFLSPGALEAEMRSAGFEIVETGNYPQSPIGRFIAARAV